MMTMVLLAKYAGLECASRDDVAIEFRTSVSDARAQLFHLLKHLPTQRRSRIWLATRSSESMMNICLATFCNAALLATF